MFITCFLAILKPLPGPLCPYTTPFSGFVNQRKSPTAGLFPKTISAQLLNFVSDGDVVGDVVLSHRNRRSNCRRILGAAGHAVGNWLRIIAAGVFVKRGDAHEAYAKLLGQKEIMALLDATLKEEEAADKKLTQIAKEVNVAALNGSPMEKD